MHELIAAPFLDNHLLVRPGSGTGVKLPPTRYLELRQALDHDHPAPTWLSEAALHTWNLDLAGRQLPGALLVREPSPYGYARASWEINKGCDYDCDHCYLGLKRFEGLPWTEKTRLLEIMRDAGVLWLQITGGEPLIDRYFPAAYAHAHSLGMMIAISSNGSQLSKPRILDVLTERRPYRLTLSMYGATAASYEGMTRSRGAFTRFTRGLEAAREAGLPVRLNIIVSRHNSHEVDAMKHLADQYGSPHQVFTNM